MAAGANDKFLKVGVAGTLTSLSAPGHSVSGATITVGSTTNWPTDTATVFAIRQVDSSGSLVAGTYTEWRGIVSGSTLTNMTLMYGTDQVYPAGSTTQVYIPLSAAAHNRLIDGILSEHDQDGTHGAITASSITATTGTFDSVVVSGTATSQGWTPLGDVPDLVTANGNRNYDLVFNGVDHTSTLSPGMKLQLTRTVAAPDQCADLEASSSQYFSRTGASVSGMTFTNNFTLSAWVKIESYGSLMVVHRTDGNSGFQMYIANTGQVAVDCLNGSPANYFAWKSYASIPLNKWVHIAAQIDMTVTTNLPTTNYVMIDGVDVAGFAVRGGTNPTSLAQAGDLRIGAAHGGSNYFDGKIAQVAIYSAKVTQANILLTMSQGLSGSETSLISAYSFDNAITDLNANANNLTANAGAAATATDSPFANAVAAGTLEYAEVNSVTFSTNTTVNVRVPDTCQIPTSGGVSAVSYSTQSNPYGLPYFSNVLGQVIIASGWVTQSTSVLQLPGASIPVYPPTGSRLRVTFTAQSMVNNTTGNSTYVVLYDGAVGSGTQFAGNIAASAIANQGVYASGYTTPASSPKTYNVSFHGDGAGTNKVVNANSSNPMYFQVELV